jgi:hypothetical protein
MRHEAAVRPARTWLGSKRVVLILPSTCVYKLFLFSSSIRSVPINFVNGENTYKNIYITRVTTPLSGRLELGSKRVVFILPSTCVYELFLFSSSILSVPIGFERYTYLNGISIPYRRCNFSNDYQRCSW